MRLMVGCSILAVLLFIQDRALFFEQSIAKTRYLQLRTQNDKAAGFLN